MSGHRRDSFDRFGDDLVEEILKYLSSRQRIAGECVAKQWQRIVFRGETDLKIYAYNEHNIIYCFNKSIYNTNYTKYTNSISIFSSDILVDNMRSESRTRYHQTNGMSVLDVILKKYSLIRTIDISYRFNT